MERQAGGDKGAGRCLLVPGAPGLLKGAYWCLGSVSVPDALARESTWQYRAPWEGSNVAKGAAADMTTRGTQWIRSQEVS